MGKVSALIILALSIHLAISLLGIISCWVCSVIIKNYMPGRADCIKKIQTQRNNKVRLWLAAFIPGINVVVLFASIILWTCSDDYFYTLARRIHK